MSRTDNEIDDELVSEVMAGYGLRSVDEAVDLALRRLAGNPGDVEQARSDARRAATGDRPAPPAG